MFWGKRERNRHGVRQVLQGSTCLLTLMVSGVVAGPARADSVYWNGPANGDWFLNSNWVWDGHVPNSSDTARINSDGPLILTGTTGQAGNLQVGSDAAATLTVQGGLDTGTATLGSTATAVGTVTVSGGTWTNTGNLLVGSEGSGTVALTAGGTVTSGTTYLGPGQGGSGTITVAGGSSFTSTDALFIGYAGTGGSPSVTGGDGTLTVTAGTVNTAAASLADGIGATGEATVSGPTSSWINTGLLVVGGGGVGTLAVKDGASLTTGSLAIGNAVQANTSSVTVSGTDSVLTSLGSLILGSNGAATLTVEDGGSLTSASAVIGRHSVSSATVTGTGSQWTTGDLQLGGDGTDPAGTLGNGHLTVSAGGKVSSSTAEVGAISGAEGSVLVEGRGSLWEVTGGPLSVGYNGTGSLTVSDGGAVTSINATIGSNATGNGTVTVTGAGSTWTSTGNIYVGNGGQGTLSIENGGVVTAVGGYVATLGGSTSSLTVTGMNSALTLSGSFIAGYSSGSSATVTLSEGGKISGMQGTLGDLAGSSGTMTISGAGSQWSAVVDANVAYSGYMNVGLTGTGSLTVTNGGSVSGYRLYIGNDAESVGTVVLSGAGSSIDMTSNLYVGSEGTGTLTLSDGAQVSAAAIKVGYLAGSTGTLNVGAAAGDAAAAAGTMIADEIVLGSGDSRLVLNHTDTDYVLSADITGTGLVSVLSGTTILTGTNTYTGGTTISVGTLQIGNGGASGSLSGDVVNNASLIFNRSGDLTYAGVISGTGSLTKTGTGTLTLTGVNTYAGGTTVSDGTLKGNTTSLQGTIVNNATVVFDETGTGTYSGTMSGSGALVKSGTGTLILSGTNTYTGGTLISSGTLQIGDGGTSGSIVGDVQNNGTLVFNLSSTYNFPGSLTGAGAVVITGGGTVNFIGASGYSGTVSVSGSDFVLASGAVSNSSYLLESGATLSGAGTIAGLTVEAGGAVAPGYSPGTLTVAGNVTFAAGSVYTVDVTPSGEHDLILATGTATLQGGTVAVNATSKGYAPTSTITILHADGGVSGTFASVTSNLAYLTPILGYDADDVFLTLQRNDISFASQALTPNQRTTAGAADALGWSNELYYALANLPVGASPAAFNLLSGEAYASVDTVIQQQSRYVRDAVGSRLMQSLSGPGVSPLAYGAGPQTAALGEGLTPTLWAQGYGGWGNSFSNGNAATISSSIGGFLVGLDVAVAPNVRAGLFGGFSQSQFDVTDRASTGSMNNVDLGAYAGAQFGAFALRGGASYTWHDIQVQRSILFSGFSGSESGGYTLGTTQVFGEAGYRMTFGAYEVEPFAGLAYVNVSGGSTTETGGGGAGLGVDVQGMSTLYTTLGVRAATTVMLGGRALTPSATLGWQHAFGDTTPTASMQFLVGSTPFQVQGVPIAQDTLLVGAGLSYALSDLASIQVNYAGQLATQASQNAFSAQFALKF